MIRNLLSGIVILSTLLFGVSCATKQPPVVVVPPPEVSYENVQVVETTKPKYVKPVSKVKPVKVAVAAPPPPSKKAEITIGEAQVEAK